MDSLADTWARTSWTTVFAYAGDALWIVALTIMFAASRNAALRTRGQGQVRYMGGTAPRLVGLWALPVASFAVSLWPALQARLVSEEISLILFGVRAITASLLALTHLRGLRDTLKP
ncbi:MAG: hypothetical protein ACJ798_07570 [Phenylobacterium sp.]